MENRLGKKVEEKEVKELNHQSIRKEAIAMIPDDVDVKVFLKMNKLLKQIRG